MTFPSSPLYNPDGQYSVSDSVEYIIELGMPPEKIMLGFGAYGFSYTLTSRRRRIGSPIIGLGSGKPGKVKNVVLNALKILKFLIVYFLLLLL